MPYQSIFYASEKDEYLLMHIDRESTELCLIYIKKFALLIIYENETFRSDWIIRRLSVASI